MAVANFVKFFFFICTSQKFFVPLQPEWIIPIFKWGISSSGRALAWHARGGQFESDMLHSPRSTPAGIFFRKKIPPLSRWDFLISTQQNLFVFSGTPEISDFWGEEE